ncbi:MAG: N-acetyltransferase family protein [Rhodobacteraceae bacterium]|nr:N-acetyltransferase family protein [Paracoccaceae bacterium]
MSIRAAVRPDAAAIADIQNWMVRDTLATFTTDLRTVSDVEDWITIGMIWVAEQDGAVLGFARLGPFRAGPGYAASFEHSVCLLPRAQGQGLGRALMGQVEQAAQQAGGHVLIAGISGANPDAIAFHHRLGFDKVGHMPQVGRKAEQWLDLILMQKILSQTLPDSRAKAG